jgi:hypothetical protein
MPEVTDLIRVAQWAKSSGSPSDVYNAACRLLDAPAEGSFRWYLKQVEAERDALNAANERMKALAERWGGGLWAERYAARELRAALDGAESHGDGRTPQTQGAVEGQEATEAQEARE